MPGITHLKDEDFQGIVAGLNDSIAFVQGDTSKGRVVTGPDVKAIRAKTKLIRRRSPTSCACPSAPTGHAEPVEGLGTAPALARCACADVVGDGRCRPEGGAGFD